MVRSLPIALGALWILANCTIDAGANPPGADDDTSMKNVLAVQQAMEQARYLLLVPNSKKAVEVLEENLPRINGNATYLRLLREAYRNHIKDLWLTKQTSLAKRYLERLCIIDPHAAQDPILCGGLQQDDKTGPAYARNFEKPAPITAAQAVTAAPIVAGPSPAPLAPRPAETSQTPPIVRAKADDPFDIAHQRMRGDPRSVARQLQTYAETEFSQRRYAQARTLYERAYQADPGTIDATRQNWAYCILCHVVEQLQQQSTPRDNLDELRKLVHGAVAMAPNLGEAGQKLMQDIDGRGGQGGKLVPVGATVGVDPSFKIQHLGKNAQGWQVAETAHFRIFHKQTQDYAEKVARIVERTRLDMYRKWFGHDGAEWITRCDVFLHATANEYYRTTGESMESPGHSRIEIDPASQRVVNRRMDMHCDQNGMLETVLPHETTHTVVAGMFGPTHVPRWADEGMAVLTETPGRIEQHRRNLIRFHKEQTLFGVRELMEQREFPARERISAWFAQSVFLVEFLAAQHGAVVFSEFLRDGLREGYELALRRHYSWSFSDLEAHWGQYLASETNRLASR